MNTCMFNKQIVKLIIIRMYFTRLVLNYTKNGQKLFDLYRLQYLKICKKNKNKNKPQTH